MLCQSCTDQRVFKMQQKRRTEGAYDASCKVGEVEGRKGEGRSRNGGVFALLTLEGMCPGNDDCYRDDDNDAVQRVRSFHQQLLRPRLGPCLASRLALFWQRVDTDRLLPQYVGSRCIPLQPLIRRLHLLLKHDTRW